VECAGPALPDFPPTLPSIQGHRAAGGDLGNFTVIPPQRLPENRNLDTRERDFSWILLEPGLTRGFPTLLGSTDL